MKFFICSIDGLFGERAGAFAGAFFFDPVRLFAFFAAIESPCGKFEGHARRFPERSRCDSCSGMLERFRSRELTLARDLSGSSSR
jgi:hypothetical protein